MKLNRAQAILVVILVGQVLLSTFMLWPRRGTSAAVQPLLAGLKDADVVAMTVTDDKGATITLRKVTGQWVYPDADDYPANSETITTVLDKIVALDTSRLVTRTDSSHKQLKVAANDFLRKLELQTGDGATFILYIGSSPNYSASHVRVEGQSEAYLAKDLSQWDLGTTAASWVDTTYFSITQDELQQVTVSNANGSFTLEKDEGGNWLLVGLAADEELNTTELNSVVSKVTQVTLNRPLGREKLADYGMDAPLAVVTLKKADETITLSVGAQDAEDSTYVVKASTSPYYVRLNEYNVRPLVQDARSDLIQPPATPTPTTSG